MSAEGASAVTLVATARMPRGDNLFQVSVFEEVRTKVQHIALTLASLANPVHEPVLTRVHSECITGDVFGSTRCDCGAQLHESLDMICLRQRGILLYLRQEGRGIGLTAKLRAYNLQDSGGFDTVDANLALGYKADERSFGAAAQMLAALGVNDVELLTNNPHKIAELRSHGVNIVTVVPFRPAVTRDNLYYLRTKRDKLGHLIHGIEDSERAD